MTETAAVQGRAGFGPREVGSFVSAWFCALLGLTTLLYAFGIDRLVDANMYWSAWQNGLYRGDYKLWHFGYSYAPPFAQALWPFAQLPWPLFGAFWAVLAWAAYAWLLQPLPMRLRVPWLISFGIWAPDNMYWMLALVAVAGFRYPAAWALPLLTKITPGVGVLWFAARAEWRKLATAILATVAMVAVSFAIAPGQWFAWRDLLFGVDINATGVSPFVPLPPVQARAVIAAALVVWGARSERWWVIPIAMLVAQPDINFPALGLLAALPRLRHAAGSRWTRRRSLEGSAGGATYAG
jgi:hypothetical protein